MSTDSADYYMFVNEWAWLRSRVCLLMLEVDLGSVLESGLEQKWRYHIFHLNFILWLQVVSSANHTNCHTIF